MINASTVLRCIGAAAGTAMGAFCAYAAFRNGMSQSVGYTDQMVQGTVGATLVVFSWTLAPAAAKFWAEKQYIASVGFTAFSLCLAPFILANTISFHSEHRSERSGFVTSEVNRYDEALNSLKSFKEDLERIKTSERWSKTASCTDVSVPKSKEFCDRYALVLSNATHYQNIVNAGKPAAKAGAGNDTLSWLASIFGVAASVDTIERTFPVSWAVFAELGSLAAWFLVFNLGGGRRKKEVLVAAEFRNGTVRLAVPELSARPLLELPAQVAGWDVTPMYEALREAELAIHMVNAAREAYYAHQVTQYFTAELETEEPQQAFTVEPEVATQEVTVAEPVAVEPAVAVEAPMVANKPKTAKQSRKAKRADKRLRDHNGRFASKAKLVTVNPSPEAKPQLGAVPLLGAGDNVYAFGPKKD